MKIYQLTKFIPQNEALSKHKAKELTYYNTKNGRTGVKANTSSKALVQAFFDNQEFEMPSISVGFVFKHKKTVGEGKEKSISYFYKLESQSEYDQAVVKGYKPFFVHGFSFVDEKQNPWHVTEVNPAGLVAGVPDDKQIDKQVSSSSAGQYTQVSTGDKEPKSPNTTPASPNLMASQVIYIPTPGETPSGDTPTGDETPGNPSSSAPEHKEGSSFSWSSFFGGCFSSNNSAKAKHENDKQKMIKEHANDLMKEDLTPGAPPPTATMSSALTFSAKRNSVVDDGVTSEVSSALPKSPSQ